MRLSDLHRAVQNAEQDDRPDPADLLDLADRIDLFAQENPVDEDTHVNLLTRLVRVVNPRAPRDSEVARRTLQLAAAGATWAQARAQERADATTVYEAIRRAVDAGVPETQAAAVAGVDRMTVRKVLGK